MSGFDYFKYHSDGLLLGQDSRDPIDWRYVIADTAWPRIFRACWKKSGFRGRWDPEQFGITPGRDNFQVIPLDLLLSDNDWAVLVRKTRNAYCLFDEKHVVKLHGNFLFFLDQEDGQCREILRFAFMDDAIIAVELLLDMDDPAFTLAHTAFIVGLFSDILPGRHFTYFSEACESGEFAFREEFLEPGHDWFWRRPDDPRCYPPKPQPWYAMNPDRCRFGSDKAELESLTLRDEQGHDLGPPCWRKAEIGLLASDPNLCSRGAVYEFIFFHDEIAGQVGSLQMFDGGIWLFTVQFDEVDNGFATPIARVNRHHQYLTFHEAGPEEICRKIVAFISDLIERKVEAHEKNRRQHRRLIPKFQGYE